MTTKGDLSRARASLERERLRLRSSIVDLDNARHAMTRERQAALVALRELGAALGDLDWSDAEPLARIVERLGAAMQARLAASGGGGGERSSATRAPITPPSTAAPLRRPSPAAAPRPLRPTALPQIEHRCLIVRAEHRGTLGYRATCTCGWRSAVESTEPGAVLAGEAHDRRFLGVGSLGAL